MSVPLKVCTAVRGSAGDTAGAGGSASDTAGDTAGGSDVNSAVAVGENSRWGVLELVPSALLLLVIVPFVF